MPGVPSPGSQMPELIRIVPIKVLFLCNNLEACLGLGPWKFPVVSVLWWCARLHQQLCSLAVCFHGLGLLCVGLSVGLDA